MTKRKRTKGTNNDLQEEFEDTKGRQSESVYRRTDTTMAKRKRTKGQTTIDMHIKLKIE
jgi:hypothetical protein